MIKITESEIEQIAIASIRNVLLPKLTNGKLRYERKNG